MKWLNSVVDAANNAVRFLKLFECIAAGFEAFGKKAKENGLYVEEKNNAAPNT